MSKQDGVAVRTAADLERKYQFGKRFSELMGIATDARDAAYDVGSTLNSTEFETRLQRTAKNITSEALKAYSTTNEMGEKLTEMSTSIMEQTAGSISASVSVVSEEIKKVDDEMQTKYKDITKRLVFDVNGLSLVALDENDKPLPTKVVLDNDEIAIMANNNEVIRFDADGNALIPTLKVEKSMKVLGLQIAEDETHINCSYIGG